MSTIKQLLEQWYPEDKPQEAPAPADPTPAPTPVPVSEPTQPQQNAPLVNVPNHLQNIIGDLRNQGHKAYIVGGAVRDAVMGKPNKDIDVEVYGTNYDNLHKALSKYGRTDTVGKSFGVIKYTDRHGNDYDFSIPRRENKTGIGHTGFDVEFDPNITPAEAASRRDFTMNSMAYDPIENKIHDWYGGMNDIKNNVIKHTSDKFSEDPLRILRAMQFQSRFGSEIHPETKELMRQMVERGDMDHLPKERISDEWMKWATKGKHHDKIFDFLRDTGLDKKFPHVGGMRGTEQDAQWHPEGDVETHTKHVLNAANAIADREGLTGDDRATLIFSALTHDLAKPHTTKKQFSAKHNRDVVTSHGHEQASGELAQDFLSNVGIKNHIIDKVRKLAENHLAHANIHGIDNDRGKRGATIKLSRRLHPATINQLAHLVEADHSGRPPLPKGLPPAMQNIVDMSKDLNIQHAKPKPIISGDDLIAMGYRPGKAMGDILRYIETLREQGQVSSREEALNLIQNNQLPPDLQTKQPVAEEVVARLKELAGIL